MALYNMNDSHRHKWVFIGTVKENNEIFKIYECEECSCWSRQRLETTGEEKMARGEVVEPAARSIK